MIPTGMSSFPLQILISPNFLGSPPTRSNGTSSSPLQIPISPNFLGLPSTHRIDSFANPLVTIIHSVSTSYTSPQPHEPLDSYVSPISSFIQISTIPYNPSPYPNIIELPNPLVSVKHSPVHHIVTRSQIGYS